MPASTRADLYMVVVTLLAASGWIFSRESIHALPPHVFMFLRFALAGAVLALVGARQLRALSGPQLWRSLRVGLAFGIGMVLWVMGLSSDVPLSEGAFIASLSVVIIPVLARWLFGEFSPLSTWLALPVAALGLGCLAFANGFHLAPGQLWYLAAAACFAFFFNLNTRAAHRATAAVAPGAPVPSPTSVPVIALTAVSLWMVAACHGLVALFTDEFTHTRWNAFGGSLAGWFLASMLLATAARFLLQTHAQSLAARSNSAVILVLEPLWVTLMAALWFGERLGPVQMLGCGLIFLALLITRWPMIRPLLRRLLGAGGVAGTPPPPPPDS